MCPVSKKYYSIAGVRFSVETPFEYAEREPYSLFTADAGVTDVRYVFHECDALPAPEGRLLFEDPNYRAYLVGDGIRRYIGFYNNGRILDPPFALAEYSASGGGDVTVYMPRDRKVPRSAAFIYRSLCVEHLITSHGGLILHSSYIKTSRGAILFTAPSETGKSTQAELWRVHRGAEVINGDCSVIRRTDGGLSAHGLPFSGTSNICSNESNVLAAIVYLTQAPQNIIRKLSGIEAYKALMQGAKVNTWHRADAAAAIDAINGIIGEVPIFRLDCTPDERAVEALERALSEN